MTKVGAGYYTINRRRAMRIGMREGIERFFIRLPFFQPWVWKMVVVIGIGGFLIGWGIGLWAYCSLTE